MISSLPSFQNHPQRFFDEGNFFYFFKNEKSVKAWNHIHSTPSFKTTPNDFCEGVFLFLIVYIGYNTKLEKISIDFEIFPLRISFYSFLLTISSLIFSSFNCFSSTSDGEPSIKDSAFFVFGNAITSLIDSFPVNIATILSIPKAMPP